MLALISTTRPTSHEMAYSQQRNLISRRKSGLRTQNLAFTVFKTNIIMRWPKLRERTTVQRVVARKRPQRGSLRRPHSASTTTHSAARNLPAFSQTPPMSSQPCLPQPSTLLRVHHTSTTPPPHLRRTSAAPPPQRHVLGQQPSPDSLLHAQETPSASLRPLRLRATRNTCNVYPPPYRRPLSFRPCLFIFKPRQ